MEKQSSVASTDFPALTAGQEERWRAVGEANVRLMRGVFSAWQQELELGQELIAENLSDPNPVTEFFSSNGDVGTQWSAAQRRFEKTIARMRRINDEFYECLFEVVAMASGNGADMKKERPARSH